MNLSQGMRHIAFALSSVTRYYTKVYLHLIADRGYAPFVQKICKKLFKGASVSGAQRPAKGTEEVQISSRDVSKYLLKWDLTRVNEPFLLD
jgi:hypothetical protein